MINYKEKYHKYKLKYLKSKNIRGGSPVRSRRHGGQGGEGESEGEYHTYVNGLFVFLIFYFIKEFMHSFFKPENAGVDAGDKVVSTGQVEHQNMTSELQELQEAFKAWNEHDAGLRQFLADQVGDPHTRIMGESEKLWTQYLKQPCKHVSDKFKELSQINDDKKVKELLNNGKNFDIIKLSLQKLMNNYQKFEKLENSIESQNK